METIIMSWASSIRKHRRTGEHINALSRLPLACRFRCHIIDACNCLTRLFLIKFNVNVGHVISVGDGPSLQLDYGIQSFRSAQLDGKSVKCSLMQAHIGASVARNDDNSTFHDWSIMNQLQLVHAAPTTPLGILNSIFIFLLPLSTLYLPKPMFRQHKSSPSRTSTT